MDRFGTFERTAEHGCRLPAAEVARLQAALPLRRGITLSATDLDAWLALAARQAGLDAEPGISAELERRRSWLLADAAYLRHADAHPSDAELERELAAQGERFRRYRLLVGTIEVGGDVEPALRTMEELSAALAASERPASTLRELAAERTDLHAASVGPSTRDELAQRSRRLAEVAGALSPGSWSGPHPVPWLEVPRAPAERGLVARGAGTPRGVAFLVLEDASLPPLALVREQLLRDRRAQLGGGVDTFLRMLGPVWDIELRC